MAKIFCFNNYVTKKAASVKATLNASMGYEAKTAPDGKCFLFKQILDVDPAV